MTGDTEVNGAYRVEGIKGKSPTIDPTKVVTKALIITSPDTVNGADTAAATKAGRLPFLFRALLALSWGP